MIRDLFDGDCLKHDRMGTLLGDGVIEDRVAADRVLQLRIYESHNCERAARKMQMFNEGGEIALYEVLWQSDDVTSMLPAMALTSRDQRRNLHNVEIANRQIHAMT